MERYTYRSVTAKPKKAIWRVFRKIGIGFAVIGAVGAGAYIGAKTMFAQDQPDMNSNAITDQPHDNDIPEITPPETQPNTPETNIIPGQNDTVFTDVDAMKLMNSVLLESLPDKVSTIYLDGDTLSVDSVQDASVVCLDFDENRMIMELDLDNHGESQNAYYSINLLGTKYPEISAQLEETLTACWSGEETSDLEKTKQDIENLSTILGSRLAQTDRMTLDLKDEQGVMMSNDTYLVGNKRLGSSRYIRYYMTVVNPGTDQQRVVKYQLELENLAGDIEATIATELSKFLNGQESELFTADNVEYGSQYMIQSKENTNTKVNHYQTEDHQYTYEY